jgi:hypothetical protein
MLQVYARGRIALVGDAAHLATPFLGQGTSQAIEDALELGRAVGGSHIPPTGTAVLRGLRRHAAALLRNTHPWGQASVVFILYPGAHGPTPEALAEYERVRVPLSGAVQETSVQVSMGG